MYVHTSEGTDFDTFVCEAVSVLDTLYPHLVKYSSRSFCTRSALLKNFLESWGGWGGWGGIEDDLFT